MAAVQIMDQQLINLIRSALISSPELELATIFGSVASGRAGPDSDLDLAVAFTTALSLDSKIELTSKLSRLAKREVDLVDLNTAHGTILEKALCSGKIIIKNNPSKLASLYIRLWTEKEDFGPIRARVLKAKRERFFNG